MPRAPKKSSNWIACETHWREERRAASHVERQGFDHYLPEMYTEMEKRTLMFPGYLFVRLEDGWRALSGTRGIRRVISFGDQPSVVRGSELDALRSQEDSAGIVRLSPRFTDGQSVVVSEGDAKFRGIVVGTPVRGRVGVLFEILGQKAGAIFNVALIEAA